VNERVGRFEADDSSVNYFVDSYRFVDIDRVCWSRNNDNSFLDRLALACKKNKINKGSS